VRIANDPASTRSAGTALSVAGRELAAAASAADPGAGAGGDASPRTDAALAALGDAWRTGLATKGTQLEALAAYIDLVVAQFERAGG
jgi:hypothetical protein